MGLEERLNPQFSTAMQKIWETFRNAYNNLDLTAHDTVQFGTAAWKNKVRDIRRYGATVALLYIYPEDGSKRFLLDDST